MREILLISAIKIGENGIYSKVLQMKFGSEKTNLRKKNLQNLSVSQERIDIKT